MKFQPIRSTIAIVALYCVILASAAFTLACPKKDAVRAAIDASYRLPAATDNLTNKVREARDRQIITVDQSKSFGEILNKMANAEVVYVGMVKALNEAMKTTGTADAGKLRELRTFFDAQVVEPFLRVLELAKVLSGPSVELVLVAITAARLLIRTIGNGIGSTFINALSIVGDPPATEIRSLEFA